MPRSSSHISRSKAPISGQVALFASPHRFTFNGKETDSEVKGEGNQQDYGMRIYDNRLGRFLSVDPLTKKFPYYTPFQFAGNMPIASIDLDGLEDYLVIHWTRNGMLVGTTIYKLRDKDKIDKNAHDIVYKTMDVTTRICTNCSGSRDIDTRRLNNENPYSQRTLKHLISDKKDWKSKFEHDEMEMVVNGGIERFAAEKNQMELVTKFFTSEYVLDIPEINPSNVTFNTGSSELTNDGKVELYKLYEKMLLIGDLRIKLVGHTDNVGSPKTNMELSKNRANSAMQYLIDLGIAPERLSAEGRGMTDPATTNDTDAGKAQNRRIEYEKL